MTDLQTRATQAEQLWARGDTALGARDLQSAYRLYTEAHDLITDCARLHEQAHRKLRTVNRLLGTRERYTDNVLLFLAPLGVFELLAFVFRSRVASHELCRRHS